MTRRGNGSSIYLGRPIAAVPGVCIGPPGQTFFKVLVQGDVMVTENDETFITETGDRFITENP